MSGQIAATQVVIRRPTLRMTRRPDGTWSTARLLPLPTLTDGPLPEVRFENGTIEIFDPTKAVACSLTLRDVNLSLAPIAPPAGQPKVAQRERIQGTAAGDYFHQVSFHGEVDLDRPALSLAGKIDGVQISPEMRNVLPDGLGSNLSVLGSLRGQTEALFQVDYDPACAAAVDVRRHRPVGGRPDRRPAAAAPADRDQRHGPRRQPGLCHPGSSRPAATRPRWS